MSRQLKGGWGRIYYYGKLVVSQNLLFCATTDVYCDLKRGHQNSLASFTHMRLISVYLTITKMVRFTICDRDRKRVLIKSNLQFYC